MVYGSGSVAASAYASHQVIRVVAALLFLQLLLDLGRYHALQSCYHIRIRMRANGTSNNIEGIRRIAAPVADSLVGSILKGLVAAVNRHHLSTQHTHALHVHSLALHVKSTHVNPAGHIHKCTNSCGCHAVLSCTGLSNNAGLTHTLSQ